MSAVRTVLVIGAGLAGTASAIRLAQAGVRWISSTSGRRHSPGIGHRPAGQCLAGAAGLGRVGQVDKHGYSYDSLGLRAPDPNGTLIVEFGRDAHRRAGSARDRGMYRPDLARILMDRARRGRCARPRLGVTPMALGQDDDRVDVEFSDGTTGRYDLVIGADGVKSWTRQAIGIDVQTTPTGMGIWRVFTRRPESVTRTDLYYGGPSYIAGYCPTGPDSLYAYVVEKAQDRFTTTPEEKLAIIRELAARTTDRGTRSGTPSPIPAPSTTPGSRPTSCPRHGTAAEW